MAHSKGIPTRRHRIEQAVSDAPVTALALTAFGVSLRHVQTVAATHGQSGWISWLIAASVELVALVSIKELARARRAGLPVPKAAVLALVAGLGMSAAANAATAKGGGAWALAVALWPVVAYALVMLIMETRPGRVAAEPATVPPPVNTVNAPPVTTIPAMQATAMPASTVTPEPAVTITHAMQATITTDAEPAPAVRPSPARIEVASTSRPSRPSDTVDYERTILNRLRAGENITYKDVMEMTELSQSWAEKTLAKLRKEVRLERAMQPEPPSQLGLGQHGGLIPAVKPV